MTGRRSETGVVGTSLCCGDGGRKVRRLGWGHCWGAAGGRELARGQSSTRHAGKSLGEGRGGATKEGESVLEMLGCPETAQAGKEMGGRRPE